MIRNYCTSVLAFVCVDSLWLGLIAPQFYRTHIGHLMSETPDLKAAVLFYAIFLLGLNIFVIQPHKESPWKTIILHAGLFGIVTYATFDLTSVAVFKDFPYLVAGIDLLWGALLSILVTVFTLKFDPIRKKSLTV